MASMKCKEGGLKKTVSLCVLVCFTDSCEMTIGDKGNTFSVNEMDMKGSLQERKEPVARKKCGIKLQVTEI